MPVTSTGMLLKVDDEDVTIDYTNHRGERFSRRVRPVRIWFGSTPWHDGEQWLLEAHDYARDELRNFALSDVHSWRVGDTDNAR